MKVLRTISVLVLLVSMSLLTTLAKDKDKDKDKSKMGGGAEQQINSLEDQSRDAALKADTSFLENNLTDDYVSVNAMGKEANKATTIEMRKTGQVKYDSIDVTDKKIHMYGNTAIVSLDANVKGTLNGQDISGPYHVTRVWVKQGGKWKAAAFQSTKIQ